MALSGAIADTRIYFFLYFLCYQSFKLHIIRCYHCHYNSSAKAEGAYLLSSQIRHRQSYCYFQECIGSSEKKIIIKM